MKTTLTLCAPRLSRMLEGTECVQRDGCEGRVGSTAKVGGGGSVRQRRRAGRVCSATKVGGGGTDWQRRDYSREGRTTKGWLPRGRSWRFQMPRSAPLLKGISYPIIFYSNNYDKSPKIYSLVNTHSVYSEYEKLRSRVCC